MTTPDTPTTGPETYEIRTISDIIEQIPADKLDHFLIDLASFVLIGKAAKEAGKELPPNLIQLTSSGCMTWIDDGEHNATIEVQIKTQGTSSSADAD